MLMASPPNLFPSLASSTSKSGLLEKLPPVRGKLIPDAPLADSTWFRVGGSAEVLFKPSDSEDLADFLAHCPSSIPLTVIGVASNLLIRDGGIPGVVIRLGPSFATLKVEGDTLVAGAGAIDLNVARAAQAASLTGIEFLSGIPGTVGGGLRMNAGAYGGEFKDIVVQVNALDRQGQHHIFQNSDMRFSYRHSGIPDDFIFVSAILKGTQGNPSLIAERMQEIQKSRSASQPIREKTGGSTFANPDKDPHHRKAWQLIDAAGCRGLTIGQAQVSEQHCNFLVNTGSATATDIETLGEQVRQMVYDQSGVQLRWEIKRIGIAPKNKGT